VITRRQAVCQCLISARGNHIAAKAKAEDHRLIAVAQGAIVERRTPDTERGFSSVDALKRAGRALR
jgi:hypothetical protein